MYMEVRAMVVTRVYNLHGVDIYYDDDVGVLVCPREFCSLQSEYIGDILDWVKKHANELEALDILDHTTLRCRDGNLATWIIEAIAQSQLASQKDRGDAEIEIANRQAEVEIQRDREEWLLLPAGKQHTRRVAFAKIRNNIIDKLGNLYGFKR